MVLKEDWFWQQWISVYIIADINWRDRFSFTYINELDDYRLSPLIYDWNNGDSKEKFELLSSRWIDEEEKNGDKKVSRTN